MKNKSKVVCINGIKGIRRWLGVTVKGGLNGGLKSMGDRKKEANGVSWHGQILLQVDQKVNFVIGREGWKGLEVNKLMYGCGALGWSPKMNVMIWK